MALVLNEEQVMLKDSAGGFLAEKATVSHLRALRDTASERGFDEAVWNEMAQMGWAGIAIPEAFGGLGYGYTGLGLVLEQAGRNLSASPLQSTVLVAATVIAGYYSANGQLYRFAAAELAADGFKEKAVSLVLAGGLIGAIVGPNLASRTRTLYEVPFLGAYMALGIVAILAMVCMSFIRFPSVPAKKPGDSAGRPLREIMRQPVFIVAAAAAALSYGVMNLLMAATPLAMQVCGFSFDDAALDDGEFFHRAFNPEIPAGHHHGIRGIDDFLDGNSDTSPQIAAN